jgi:hypothetical protein
MRAARLNHVDIVDALLTHDADVYIRDLVGIVVRSHCLSLSVDEQLIRTLPIACLLLLFILSFASCWSLFPTCRHYHQDGKTALDHAREQENTDIVTKLEGA